jgi:hypothetical protein
VAAPSSSEELGRLAPTPSKLWSLHISVALSHAEVILYATKKKITTRRSRGVHHDRQEDVQWQGPAKELKPQFLTHTVTTVLVEEEETTDSAPRHHASAERYQLSSTSSSALI